MALASLPIALHAHEFFTTKITWTREVSRIVYKRCASCHNEGGAAFSLIAYKEVRPWAKAIAEQVLTRRMPPWNAVKGFGEFKNDSGLTQEELSIIADWVEGGAPEGNPTYLPAAPHLHPAEEPASAGTRIVAFAGSKVIAQGVEAIGIRPTATPANGVLQAIAQLPDGRIEPLLWVQRFNPGFDGVYYFRTAFRFPKGTRIEVTPLGGEVALTIKASKSAR